MATKKRSKRRKNISDGALIALTIGGVMLLAAAPFVVVGVIASKAMKKMDEPFGNEPSPKIPTPQDFPSNLPTQPGWTY